MKEVKVLAFYLPQFHEILENNKWWGDGFTEWTNTKKSKPLFKNHYQPRIPDNEKYYNLLNDNDRLWQINIAKKYGLSGFVYYHYWFKGKMLLEKPAELLLENKSIDFPFCFAWANETWSRTWYGNNNEILLEQDYGDNNDWEKHFYYLLDFFLDSRYIRIDNKPIFIIYKSSSINFSDEIIGLWNNLAKENNLDGIYFINMLTGYEHDNKSKRFNAQIEFEPMYTLSHCLPNYYKIFNKITYSFRHKVIKKIKSNPFLGKFYNYDLIWKNIINRKRSNTKKTFLGAFVDWDNSPRKKEFATIFYGATPKKFYKYLYEQIKRSKEEYNSEFIFINAWNEWSEGTYLEPDEKYEFSYLEGMKKAIDKNLL
ncbi:MAG: glycoside hydrolase family 99-like domain-containing protein [Cyanobacteriota bacterium]